MGFVFSNWSNQEGEEDFEIEHNDSNTDSCDNAKSKISNFKVHTYGYTEDMPEPEPQPNPEPEPEPVAQFHELETYASYWGGDWSMHVKGLDDRHVSTDGRTLYMGQNNRAWINDYAYDESVWWAYRHNYLAGSMSYDVDLHEVDCACRSGVYLVDYDYESCNWDAKAIGEDPQCARFEVMEANKFFFSTSAYPCNDGVCEDSTQSTAVANGDDGKYGPGTFYTINTDEPFNVNVRFWADNRWRLTKITTELTQNGTTITLVQDDANYIYSLYRSLYYGMTAVVSNFNSTSAESTRDKCQNECGFYSSTLSNFEWKEYNSWDR